jgi:mannose-6-phosphate isomerase-like protein (cupin superfamily)
MLVPRANPPTRTPDMVNPVTGDRLWFVTLPRSAADCVVFECELPARSPGTPLHFHPCTTERFECVAGTLSMIAGDRRRPLGLSVGESVDVPANMPHRFWNASDDPVRFRSTVTPGVEFEQFLRTVYALGIAGRVGPSGMPKNPLELAVLRELSDLYFAGVPSAIQRPVFGALSILAGLARTRKRLSKLALELTPSLRSAS